MTAATILYLLFAHWVSDFVLQTDWQAKNKSSNLEALMRHVGSNSAGMFFFCLPLLFFGITIDQILLFFAMNFVVHFFIDYNTSRLNSRFWGEGRVHDFFVSVGFDQFLHHAMIIYGVVYIFGLYE